MKKNYLIVIAVLVFVISILLAWIFLFPNSLNPKDNIDDDITDVEPEENSETVIEDEQDPSSEVTIQEDGGNIVITIPDDQESAGE